MPKSFNNKIFISLKDLLNMQQHAAKQNLRVCNHNLKLGLNLKYAAKLRNRALSFDDVRTYATTDDISRTDWRNSARGNRAYTKMYLPETEKPVLFIVDQSRSMFFGSSLFTKSVVAAKLAAFLAFAVKKQGDNVGGIVCSNPDIDVIYPRRNKDNIIRFFSSLVKQNNKINQQTALNEKKVLHAALSKALNLVTQNFLIVVISDFMDIHQHEYELLAKLKQHNDVMVARIWDKMDCNLPEAVFMMEEQNMQMLVTGNNSKLQKLLTTDSGKQLKSLEQNLYKHHIPILHFNTHQSIQKQWRNYISENK